MCAINDADIIEIKILTGDNKCSNIRSHDPAPLTLYHFCIRITLYIFLTCTLSRFICNTYIIMIIQNGWVVKTAGSCAQFDHSREDDGGNG